MTDMTDLPSWGILKKNYSDKKLSLNELFARDNNRFAKFSVLLPGLLADFSKNLISDEVMRLLFSMADEAGLAQARDNLVLGKKVNLSENRAAFHTALRAPEHESMHLDGEDAVAGIHKNLLNMGFFANAVRNGEWRGYGGQQITDIVNIGIGGSVLGPQLVTEALSAYHHPRLTCHFVSNVDASDLARVLQKLSPETTLFIIASKTFTTAETMQNARLAQDWLLAHYKKGKDPVAFHFAAASTNIKVVEAFGISPANMFPFQDWVGGRYSVWSSIGLSVMLMIGPDNFSAFLAGAREMDEHFKTAPFAANLPVIMAMIGIWYRNFMDCPAIAVIPYHAVLRRLPCYLQQVEMESNGKSVKHDGHDVPVKTAPIVFGEPGTDAQHIFFQWMHQGTDIIPVDFIAAIATAYDTPDQRNMLLANFLAQSEALMTGREDKVEPQRNFSGNRPSTTLLFDQFDPRSVGMLLALYEHKVFVQGVMWGINSFDQWGVGLGKDMALVLEKEITAKSSGQHDGSTLGLLERIISHQLKPTDASIARVPAHETAQDGVLLL